MDIALVLDRLVPNGNWQGSVTDNTEDAFNFLSWNDKRIKPSWENIMLEWQRIKSEPPPPRPITIIELINALEKKDNGRLNAWNNIVIRARLLLKQE